MQEFLGYADILVRKVMRIHGRDFFMPVCIAEVNTVDRAIDGNLSLGAAAGGANVTSDTRAEPPRPPHMTNRARHFSSIEEGLRWRLRIYSSKWKWRWQTKRGPKN